RSALVRPGRQRAAGLLVGEGDARAGPAPGADPLLQLVAGDGLTVPPAVLCWPAVDGEQQVVAAEAGHSETRASAASSRPAAARKSSSSMQPSRRSPVSKRATSPSANRPHVSGSGLGKASTVPMPDRYRR